MLLCTSVGFDDVFNLPSADGTAGVGHFLELQATAIAETHVSTRIDDRVHCVLVADGALIRARPAIRWKCG